jgi:hypothetical protein
MAATTATEPKGTGSSAGPSASAAVPPDVEAKLRALVEANPGQGSYEEYAHIWQTIAARAPGKVLVFGVGRDTPLWLEANAGGRTVFVEHEPEWIAETRRRQPEAEVVQVRYRTRARWWRLYLLVPARLEMRDLPDDVRREQWDVIFVDSPQGFNAKTPGRMASIYTAAQMAGELGGVDVLVHDTNRTIERRCGDRFCGVENLVAAVRTLRHYRVPRQQVR